MQRLIEELFDSYYPDVYRYLYSLSRDASLSEDLAQETFLDAIRYISSFRGEANVKTWLFAIARNRWYTHLRKKKRQVNTTSLSILLDSGTTPPEDQYQLKEISERIHQIINNEPERTQKVILMRLEGFLYYEISEQVGISESSARVIDFRAKEKIKKTLLREGLVSE